MTELALLISNAQQRENKIELLLCSTGQHREILEQVMSVFNATLDLVSEVICENQLLSKSISRSFDIVSKVISAYLTDVVVVQGDTISNFTTGLAAFYLYTPVVYLEARLSKGYTNSLFPKELNYKTIGCKAHWHFTLKLLAKNNLIKEGAESKKMFITDNTLVDATEIDRSIWQQSPSGNVFSNYFLGKKLEYIKSYRLEDFGEGLEQICFSIKTRCTRFAGHGFIFPVQPREAFLG